MAGRVGTGSIIQMEKDKPRGKCRKWKLVVSLGKDPRTGRYRQKSRVVHGTYSESKRALRQLNEEVDRGLVVPRSPWTLRDYIDHFMKSREASGQCSQQTLITNRSRLDALVFAMGDPLLQDITPIALENAYADMRQGVSRSGRGLSSTFICEVNETTSLMMEHALKNNVVGSNPCRSITPPKRDTKEKRALTDQQINELLAKLDCSRAEHCAIALCLTQGLRRGEACGLSYGDLDFETRTTLVRHSFDIYGNLKQPKTDAGVRYLPMSSYSYEALRKRVERVEGVMQRTRPEMLIKLPDGTVCLADDAPLLCNGDGERLRPYCISSWWARHRDELGLSGWTLHELRHTFLTVAARKGVHPAVMQQLAGHSTSRITMEIYTHVNMEQKRMAMDAMEEVFMA